MHTNGSIISTEQTAAQKSRNASKVEANQMNQMTKTCNNY